MKPPPPGPSGRAETSQAAAVPGRPARTDVRGAGKWLMLLVLGVLMAGLVAYKLILGDGVNLRMKVLAASSPGSTVRVRSTTPILTLRLWLICASDIHA